MPFIFCNQLKATKEVLSMNIHILSDLHLDHAAYTPEETIADLVILAGDIAEGDAGVLWAKASFNKPTS